MKRLVGLVSAAVATVGVVWAAAGPDSLLQNYVVDPIRVRQVSDCHMKYWNDQPPQNGSVVVVCFHGWYADGEPTFEKAENVFKPAVIIFQSLDDDYDAEAGFSYCVITYDPRLGPMEAARQARGLIEGDEYMTRASTRFIFCTHSFGGWVGRCYVLQFGNRKVLGQLSAGTPWEGAMFANEQMTTDAIEEVYPITGKLVSDKIVQGIDFDSDSLKWMDPNSTERKQALTESPLDETYFLYVGEIRPLSGDIVSRNITPLALYDAWGWKSDSIRDILVYRLGARLIVASGDTSGSDGVASVASVSAASADHQATVRYMGERNHSQIIQGSQGDMALHQQMYEDMISLLPAKSKVDNEFGNFDFWLPEVPIIEIPELVDLKSARLVWIRDGQIYIAKAGGDSSRQLLLGKGEFSWPQWQGNSLLVARSTSQGSDILLIQDDGQVVRLTTDHTSSLAASRDDDSVLAYISDGRLMMRSEGGLVRVVVDDNLQLATPPVIQGNKIYFADRNVGGGYDLYWVSSAAQHYSLDRAKKVGESTQAPMVVGKLLLAYKENGDQMDLTVVLGGLFGINHIGLSIPLRYVIAQSRESDITQVGIDSNSQDIYFVLDGKIRQLNTAVAADYLSDWGEELGSMIAGESEGEFFIPALDECAPVITSGVQLDVK